MYLSDGFAVMPEQSTVAIIAHHPDAVYFGMKSGFIPKDGPAPDEVIELSERSANPPEEDPDVDPEVGEIGAAATGEAPANAAGYRRKRKVLTFEVSCRFRCRRP